MIRHDDARRRPIQPRRRAAAASAIANKVTTMPCHFRQLAGQRATITL